MKFCNNIMLSKSELLANVLPRLVPGNDSDKYSEYAHVSFLDMTVLFYLPIVKNYNQYITLMIPDMIRNVYDIKITELFDAATENMEREVVIKPLETIVKEWTGESVPEMNGPCPLLVVSNKEYYLGAASILSKKALNKLQRKVGDFVVLPSSVHEVIVLPYDPDADIRELVYMVRAVNEAEVALPDKLSDNVYLWRNGRFVVIH